MLSRRFDREIAALALPALGTLAADPLISLVDTAFVGRLGPVPLGALGVCTAVFSLVFFVFNFLAYGTTPRVARALGRGDEGAAGRAIVDALSLALLLGLLALAALEVATPLVLELMGARGPLFEAALVYLRIRLLALPALTLILAANGAYRGAHDTGTPFRVTLLLNAVNLILDPLLIFVFGWGLAGAAWATVTAQWVGAGAFLWLLLGRDRRLLAGQLSLPHWRAMLPFLKVGWELAVRTFSLTLALAIAAATATRLGVVEVATHQVAVQLWLFLALVIDALAIAAQSLVAGYIGARRPATARTVSDRLLLLGFIVGVVLGIAFWLARGPLALAFSDDPLVVEGLIALFPFVALMQPLNALVFVWDGIFMGIEDFSYLAVAMVASSLVGIVLFLLVIPLGWGLGGVWWGIVALTIARLTSLGLRYWGPGRPFRTRARRPS